MDTPTPDNAASANPVAWRRRYICPNEGPSLWLPADEREAALLREYDFYEVEPLYSAATVTALEAEVRELRDSLDALVQAASPLVTDDVQQERVIETTTRGRTSISIDPFPLMKFRHEDMRDLKNELERARRTLTGAGAK